MGAYLGFFLPPKAAVFAPPRALVSVGLLTAYLAATAWMTVRRKEGKLGLFEKGAFLAGLGVAAALLFFGIDTARAAIGLSGGGQSGGTPASPYFVFASFAAFAAALDLKVILRGGISGVARIARHLWRMCFAFFFATSFFFIGQQKVMPVWMHGSPVLLALGLAPLALMIFWLIRVRVTRQFKGEAVAAGNTP